MVTLKGENIYLRALEPEDLDFVYVIENDEQIWEMSSTQTNTILQVFDQTISRTFL